MKRLMQSAYVYVFVTISGYIAYLGQSIFYAFTQRSIIDENLYLYKGYLFATGVYRPFQDYGFWTQKAPLSYLVYGWVEMLFGPGLRTGRYFSVILGLITVALLWLVARRISGKWWATGLVWVVVLSPVEIRYFSAALSQGLVAFLLMAILFLALGEKRPVWQVVLAGFLAGALVMTRQNMLPVPLFLLAYILWQHGWKKFLLSTVASLVPVLMIHALYWPDILKMWSLWLPESLTPFLDAWRLSVLPSVPASGDVSSTAKLLSILEGFRFHFAALAGGLITLLLWPGKKGWKSPAHFRDTVFLSVLFLILVIFHALAGMGNTPASINNGPFTFSSYLSSFAFLGLLVAISIFPALGRDLHPVRQTVVKISVVLVSIGIGYGNFEIIGDALAKIPILRVNNFFLTWQLQAGTTSLWEVLYNKFGISYDTSRGLLSGIAGLLTALLFLGFCRVLRGHLHKLMINLSSGTVAGLSFVLVGTLLGPSPVFGTGFHIWSCTGNVISTYEQTGTYLAGAIPPGSQVYWAGENASAVLSYVSDVKIFPQQLDSKWNYVISTDTDALARYGFWNDELKNQWTNMANVFLIQQVNYSDWQDYINNDNFNEYPPMNLPLNCDSETYLRIFIRKP